MAADPAAGRRAGPGRRGRRGAAHRALLRRAAARRGARPGRCRRRWSTGPPPGCCGRSASSGLLDPGWDPVPAALAGPDTTGPGPARQPGPGPAAGRGVGGPAGQRRHPAAARRAAARRSPWSARGPTTRTPCWAATPFPATSGVRVPGPGPRGRDPDRAGRAARTSSRTPTIELRARLRGGRPRPVRPGRGGRAGPRPRPVRRGGRRPVRAVRPGHLRGGLRRRRPDPARRAGPAAGRAAGHRHPGGRGAADRAPVRARPVHRRRPPSCRRSSPARKAGRRWPGCCPARSTRRAGCRSACPGTPGPSPPPTSARRWPSGAGQLDRPDPALPVRARPDLHLVRLGRRALRRARLGARSR